MKTEIKNARIKSTILGQGDRGIFEIWLNLEGDGWGVGFGGYAVDEWVEPLKRRVDMKGTGLEYIKILLEVVGVDKWEDLPNKFVRVETEGWGGRAKGIGHITKDNWFYPEDFFRKQARSERK